MARRRLSTAPSAKYIEDRHSTRCGECCVENISAQRLTSVGPFPGRSRTELDVLMASPWVTRTRAAYLAWLELASHEIFHAWNVKRLRPVELGPFDYETEVHTRSLWEAEGVTEYYGLLAVHRAGFSNRDEFLGSLSGLIEELQTLPGGRVQSAELASLTPYITTGRRNSRIPR